MGAWLRKEANTFGDKRGKLFDETVKQNAGEYVLREGDGVSAGKKTRRGPAGAPPRGDGRVCSIYEAASPTHPPTLVLKENTIDGASNHPSSRVRQQGGDARDQW